MSNVVPTPAGWYPTDKPIYERFWDGYNWTNEFRLTPAYTKDGQLKAVYKGDGTSSLLTAGIITFVMPLMMILMIVVTLTLNVSIPAVTIALSVVAGGTAILPISILAKYNKAKKELTALRAGRSI